MAEDEQVDRTTTTSRRRLIQAGAGAAAVAWAAPSITTAAGAAVGTQTPPPQPGSVTGFVGVCGHELFPGDQWEVSVVDPVGGGSGTTTTNPAGSFFICCLPPGTYDGTIHPNGSSNTGNPDQGYKAAFTVTAGAMAVWDPDYTAGGC